MTVIVAVIVEGGLVRNVLSNDPTVDIIVIDHDSTNEEDAAETARCAIEAEMLCPHEIY